jgi:Fe-S cluster assembly protein SufD
MTMATAAVVGGLSRLEPQPNGHHPAWLTEARRAAFGWVTEHGFPTLKDEDWRYTRLGPILEVPFEPAVAGVGHRVSSSTIDALVADLGGTRLVFVNGHFASELSRLTKLPAGVTVTSLASVVAQ